MTRSHIDDVNDLFAKHDWLRPATPGPIKQHLLMQRISLMLEELGEFARAANAREFEDQADSLVDLIYFALGTAVMMGLPWQELWDDVHKTNMTKVIGLTRRGFAKDLIKPDDWVGPNTLTILERAGYERELYLDMFNNPSDDASRE